MYKSWQDASDTRAQSQRKYDRENTDTDIPHDHGVKARNSRQKLLLSQEASTWIHFLFIPKDSILKETEVFVFSNDNAV